MIRFLFAVYFRNTSKAQLFYYFDDYIGKKHIQIFQTTISFYSKKDFKLIKNRYFLVKKGDIQVIKFMIMLTLSSMRCTGINNFFQAIYTTRLG